MNILFFFINVLYKCNGAPIGMPKDFASLDLAIIHPSLLDNTTTGLFLNKGLKTLSQET